ncbi:hypothetical protein LUZ63_012267 [Rhynchospora breviuscula]|uniref:DDE Tnp4 domain-containing protein n=1 Tax=Rhynchospora breviuscula TaxID=2022672 RepID=A0A9Q0CLD0_9POAL|nr:hypothetical protein LUZ63_012267 [Rhynchospora breviuscula]
MSDSDDSSCDDLFMEAAAWWYNAAQTCASEWKELKHDREMSGKAYILRQLNGHDMICYDNYRISTANFYLLCDELKSKGLECNGDVIIEEHLAMFLQMVGQGATMRKLTEDFQHSEETVWRCIRKVLHCVLLMKSDYIKLPAADAPVHPRVKQPQFLPFKDALGAIDGTHINAFPESDEAFKERWRNRKGNMTQNVMAVVDFNGYFLYVVAGWEGSAHDNLILRRAIERGFTVPPGRYYLVDGGYANTPQFISPYRGKTYHLAQFRTRSRQNRYDCAQELFNHRHAQLRNIVEKTFGILKGRFKICKEMHNYKYDVQTGLIIACCVLHNFIKRHQQENLDDDDDDDESDTDKSDNDDEDADEEEYRGTDAQVGGALRDRIRDMLWDDR